MFSSKSFIVSGLKFRSLIHFEFIFVYGARKYSNFIPLYVATQFSHTTYWRDGHYFFSSHLSESTYFHKRHHPASFIFLVVFLYIIYIYVCVCVCVCVKWINTYKYNVLGWPKSSLWLFIRCYGIFLPTQYKHISDCLKVWSIIFFKSWFNLFSHTAYSLKHSAFQFFLSYLLPIS